jgi:hypothetical protein
MKTLDIIQQGDIAKYQLIISRDGFDPQTCDFQVTLSWGIVNRGQMVIKRENMYHDEDWNLFFMFDTTTMHGMLTADCEYYVLDSDTESGERRNVDRQILCLVADSGIAQLPRCAESKDRMVMYKRTLRADAKSLYAIVRADGYIVRTSDNNVVRVRKHDLS